MIAPGSIEDWTLFAGMLASLSALAVCVHRWVLQETVTPERSRSHPLAAPVSSSSRVSTTVGAGGVRSERHHATR